MLIELAAAFVTQNPSIFRNADGMPETVSYIMLTIGDTDQVSPGLDWLSPDFHVLCGTFDVPDLPELDRINVWGNPGT